jgi:putative flippase GtrA
MNSTDAVRGRSWAARLWSRNAAVLLGRNTIVSIVMFLLGLALLWLAVEHGGMDEVVATGLTFLVATSLHYALGRAWIYRGTERKVLPGYGLFLANALIGLVMTVALFALLMRVTPLHYLVARTMVSVVAGLAMFLSNAILNFKRL